VYIRRRCHGTSVMVAGDLTLHGSLGDDGGFPRKKQTDDPRRMAVKV
jgi:hypothetical protein